MDPVCTMFAWISAWIHGARFPISRASQRFGCDLRRIDVLFIPLVIINLCILFHSPNQSKTTAYDIYKQQIGNEVGALYTVYIGNETGNRCAHLLNMHRTDIFYTDFLSHDWSTVRYRDGAFSSKCQLTLMVLYRSTKLGIIWYLILY